jgi:hypothetical protein
MLKICNYFNLDFTVIYEFIVSVLTDNATIGLV